MSQVFKLSCLTSSNSRSLKYFVLSIQHYFFLPGVDVTRQGSLVRILDWHHVAWCVKTWALTTLNMSIIKSSANLQNPPFSLQTPRENHRDRSSGVQKSWIAQIFWHGNSQFVLTRRKSVSSISFWWQVQFPLVTNYWRRGPNQDETRLVNQSSWITVW